MSRTKIPQLLLFSAIRPPEGARSVFYRKAHWIGQARLLLMVLEFAKTASNMMCVSIFETKNFLAWMGPRTHFFLVFFILVLLGAPQACWPKGPVPQAQEESAIPQPPDLSKLCEESLTRFPGPSDSALLRKACEKVTLLPGCTSVKNVPLFHYERSGNRKGYKRILVFSLIHGDEAGAGSVGRYWMENLERIFPRNTWRVIPVLNPDGFALKTRTNANEVDLNRNFPTKDWTELAHTYWLKTRSNPRRFPGEKPASEPETICALKHLTDFKPDFVVSIHTPLNVLDFDGPQLRPPKYKYLPWRSLGHFPGSLGRYLWYERKTPVLTMELKQSLPTKLDTFEQLQDVIGSLVKFEN